MVLDAEGLVAAPAHLSDVKAATLPCAALTAWSALVSEGRVQPGARVLVQGTGGIVLFALQFAKLLGAYTIVISSSDEKLARARALAADATQSHRSDAIHPGAVVARRIVTHSHPRERERASAANAGAVVGRAADLAVLDGNIGDRDGGRHRVHRRRAARSTAAARPRLSHWLVQSARQLARQ